MIVDLVPVSTRTVSWTVLLCLGLPMALTLVTMLAVRADAAGVAKMTVIVAALAAPVAIALLWNLSRNELRVAGDNVEIKAGLYRLTLARADLDFAQSRVVDRKGLRELSPAWRTNGIALPGYQAGWFKLRNGAKAFHLVTGPVVLAVPTARGIWLVLSPRDPAAFRQAVDAPEA